MVEPSHMKWFKIAHQLLSNHLPQAGGSGVRASAPFAVATEPAHQPPHLRTNASKPEAVARERGPENGCPVYQPAYMQALNRPRFIQPQPYADPMHSHQPGSTNLMTTLP
jgi:hypothetical protein